MSVAVINSGLVNGRKQGKWIYYSLDEEAIKSVQAFLNEISTSKDDCVCKESDYVLVCE